MVQQNIGILLSEITPNKLLPSQLGDKLFKLVKVLKDKDPDFYRLIISSFDQPDSLVIGGSEYKGLIWKNNFDEFLTDYVERLKLLDTLTYLPDDILTKADRKIKYGSFSYGKSTYIRS